MKSGVPLALVEDQSPIAGASSPSGSCSGREGIGGIYFDDAELARSIGVVGLLAILFEGGLTTDWNDIRPVLAPAFLLRPGWRDAMTRPRSVGGRRA